MSEFRKGIKKPEFIQQLKKLSVVDSWWRDVLMERRLLICVRNEALNVYWQGQSIFKVGFDSVVRVSTHAKYLVDPDLKHQVPLRDRTFDQSSLRDALTKNYLGPSTLERLIRASQPYVHGEKKGVHAIAVRDNTSVVDVEIQSSAQDDAGERDDGRLDVATFEGRGAVVNLVFWEAKQFWNPELRAKAGEPKVIRSLLKYRRILKEHKQEILQSYRVVASNLVDIAEMSGGIRSVAPNVRAVSNGDATLEMIDDNNLGLIIFNYSAAEDSDPVWKRHLEKLKQLADFPGLRIRKAGDAKNIKL
jgi:hypothetical protein